jgi:demethylmenaquinone methyltransferase/2-methoxy-6-polyprenyl-1,4-benzoquinol methylase
MQSEVSFSTRGRGQIGTIPVWSRSIGSWRFSIGRQPFAADELEGHYDKASKTWQTTISKLGFDDAYADLIDQAMQPRFEMADLGNLHVLDAGIGTGAMSCAFASQCGHAFDLVGTDVSSEMLRHADENLQKCNIKARLVQGDLNALPFADNTFDVVMVAHVLEHMADPEVALAELCRVLKPGGVLIACITRRSSAGAYIQFKWRTHRVDSDTAKRWFERCGLRNVRDITLNRSATARRLSNGYVGFKTKPAAIHRESR